ncbi:hypothetical protein WA026_003701 [Henosepilachna vigintioctopunctata]|uniref:cyclic pyranopterin monophosphate synthase n=1 Tax=Henosepilachna vigintioctopunctata TaxID=420089 RepID=A0AAW1UE30_9CUCU
MKSSFRTKTKMSFNFTFKRTYCQSSKKLSHVDEQGKANMVDVTQKESTKRIATARGSIYVGAEVMKLITENNIKKGDVLGVSKLSGIIAAKKTSDLIPLCHNIPLHSVKLTTTLIEDSYVIIIEATVSSEGKTGVEMEALTAVSISALTIYDMCKAVSKNMKINDIHLIKKSGGASGDYNSEIKVKDYTDVPMTQKTVFLGGI